MNSVSSIQTAYVGTCAASFGELLQGVLPGEKHFLVTLPINATTRVYFYPNQDSGILVFPSSKTKTVLFIKKIKEKFSLDFSGTFIVESGVLEGKGLSSSTADMVAAVRALEDYYDYCFDPSSIDEVLREVEPSDGLLYGGNNVYYNRECRFAEHLGVLPKTTLLSVDFGGVVDTVDYNRQKKFFSSHLQQIYANLLQELTIAFQKGDLFAIGKVATQSALLNQEFNYKKELDGCLDLARKYGAYGVVNTHSGTCLGFLLDPDTTVLARITDELLEMFPDKVLYLYHTN